MTEQLAALLAELEEFGRRDDAATADRPRRMLNITRDTGEFLDVLVHDDAGKVPQRLADAQFTPRLVPVGSNGEFLAAKLGRRT